MFQIHYENALLLPYLILNIDFILTEIYTYTTHTHTQKLTAILYASMCRVFIVLIHLSCTFYLQ